MQSMNDPGPTPVQPSLDLRTGPADSPKSPGPSRLKFRLHRLWQTTWVRRTVFVGLPTIALTMLGLHAATDQATRAQIAEWRGAVVQSLSSRPEFAIRGYRVAGASPGLDQIIADKVRIPKGASSLTVDVASVRMIVASIAAVRSARVTLAPDGMLDIHVDERRGVALWRDGLDDAWVIDLDGVAIAPVKARSDHPALPVIIGEGAEKSVAEALRILGAVPDMRPRVRAMIRVGKRRWNVALMGDVTVLLPEVEPAAALARVMAWHYGEEVLDRGVSEIDMRLPERPTLRMTPGAVDVRRLHDAIRSETGEET